MESNATESDGSPQREFYLPATAVLSPVPGRLERFLTRRLRDHSGLGPRALPERAASRPTVGGR